MATEGSKSDQSLWNPTNFDPSMASLRHRKMTCGHDLRLEERRFKFY